MFLWECQRAVAWTVNCEQVARQSTIGHIYIYAFPHQQSQRRLLLNLDWLKEDLADLTVIITVPVYTFVLLSRNIRLLQLGVFGAVMV